MENGQRAKRSSSQKWRLMLYGGGGLSQTFMSHCRTWPLRDGLADPHDNPATVMTETVSELPDYSTLPDPQGWYGAYRPRRRSMKLNPVR